MDIDGNASGAMGNASGAVVTSNSGVSVLFEKIVAACMRPSMRSWSLDPGFRRKQTSIAPDAPCLRRVLSKVLESPPFAAITMCVIAANAALIVLETNCSAANLRGDECETPFEEINHFFVIFYSIELVIRVYVFQHEFCDTKTNLLDLFVVIMGVLDVILQRWLLGSSTILSAVSILRIFRIARVLRLWRLVSFFPELFAMLKGLVYAFRTMFWGVMMIFALLATFAVVTVELVYPVAYELSQDDPAVQQCVMDFATVEDAFLTLFQTTVAGDAWGKCAIQLIRNHDQWWVFIILSSVLVCINLGLVNLVLSSIVGSAFAENRADRECALRVEYEREREAVVRILTIMRQIDADGDGIIDYADFEAGYRNNKELRDLLKDMEIDHNDMRIIFDMMDADRAEKFSYGDFIESLQKSKAQDVKLQLLFLKLQMSQVKNVLTNRAEDVALHPEESLAAPVAFKSINGGGPGNRGNWDGLVASERISLEVKLAEVSSLEVQLAEMNEAIATLLERQVVTVTNFKERVSMWLPDEACHLVTRGGRCENPCKPGYSTPLTSAGRGDGCGAAGGTSGGCGTHTPEQQSEPRLGAGGVLESQVVSIELDAILPGQSSRPPRAGTPGTD